MGSIDILKSLSTVLSSAVNKPQHLKRKLLGNGENRTQGCSVRDNYATSVLCSPRKRAPILECLSHFNARDHV